MKKNHGFDVKNEKYGDMFKMGVIDPLKVTKNAFINAVSVATTILSTNAIVTHAESEKINYLIKECRQKALLDKLYKKQTIDLDNFFKYSGRIEKD